MIPPKSSFKISHFIVAWFCLELRNNHRTTTCILTDNRNPSVFYSFRVQIIFVNIPSALFHANQIAWHDASKFLNHNCQIWRYIDVHAFAQEAIAPQCIAGRSASKTPPFNFQNSYLPLAQVLTEYRATVTQTSNYHRLFLCHLWNCFTFLSCSV